MRYNDFAMSTRFEHGSGWDSPETKASGLGLPYPAPRVEVIGRARMEWRPEDGQYLVCLNCNEELKFFTGQPGVRSCSCGGISIMAPTADT
jgi:hypothetical protein